MATIGTRLYTWLHGRKVGTDGFGNVYYEESRPAKGRTTRRWVLYKGLPEPSKVPPNWHGWLHYTLDAPLPETPSHPWVKPPLPNLTGTKEAYLPQGHVARTGEHAATIADYQPWTPS